MGVGVELSGCPLQPAVKQATKNKQINRTRILNLLIVNVFGRVLGTLRNGLTRDAVLAFDPASKVDQLTSF